MAISVLIAHGSAYAADPLRSLDAVGPAIRRCWVPPALPGGMFVTLAFSLRRDGALLGPPHLAAVSPATSPEARRALVDAAETAFRDCMPLHLAPALGANIAGQVLTMRFSGAGH